MSLRTLLLIITSLVKPHKSHWTNFPLLSRTEISVRNKKKHNIALRPTSARKRFGDFPSFFFPFHRGKFSFCWNKIFMEEKWITKASCERAQRKRSYTHKKKRLFNYTEKEKFEKVKMMAESLKRRNKIFIRISFEYDAIHKILHSPSDTLRSAQAGYMLDSSTILINNWMILKKKKERTRRGNKLSPHFSLSPRHKQYLFSNKFFPSFLLWLSGFYRSKSSE